KQEEWKCTTAIVPNWSNSKTEFTRRSFRPMRLRVRVPPMDLMLDALAHTLTGVIALACPSCGKRIGREFRKRVPEIISDANRLAVLFYRDEHLHLHQSPQKH